MKRLNHNARVLVTDGARAIIFRNEAMPLRPNSRRSAACRPSPAAHDQGTDRPGRTNSSTGQISAMEITDPHHQAEDRFVAGIAADMERTSAPASSRS